MEMNAAHKDVFGTSRWKRWVGVAWDAVCAGDEELQREERRINDCLCLCVSDNYCWHNSCLCDSPHLCNTSIITSAAVLLRLLEHEEDTEMSSPIYQSVWHNIPDNLNLYLSSSNINSKSWNMKINPLPANMENMVRSE